MAHFVSHHPSFFCVLRLLRLRHSFSSWCSQRPGRKKKKEFLRVARTSTTREATCLDPDTHARFGTRAEHRPERGARPRAPRAHTRTLSLHSTTNTKQTNYDNQHTTTHLLAFSTNTTARTQKKLRGRDDCSINDPPSSSP